MPCCGSKPPREPEETLAEGDCRYKVGGRYRLARAVQLFSDESLGGSCQSNLKRKESVLIIHIEGSPGSWKAQVIPQPTGELPAGWISLEDGNPGKPSPPLELPKLDGSWEMKARYCVKNAATVRKGLAIDSDWAGELSPGEEVLVMDLGMTAASGKARLRALVSTGDMIGWISPETVAGDHLLQPVNLLSHKVVDLHRVSLRNSSTGGPRKSYHVGGNTPWEADATYRMLEKVPVRQSPELSSAEIFKVSAGSLVAVAELHNVEVPGGGWCPVASITVEDGPEKDRKGWVRCSAKDGHDLMDTRDHKEYEKVLGKMRKSLSGKMPMDASPAEIQAGIVAEEQAKAEAEAVAASPSLPTVTLEVVKEEVEEGAGGYRNPPEDTDQDQKQPNTFRDAFSEEKLRQEEQQREKEAASKAEQELAKIRQDYHEKLNQLDSYHQEERPVVDPRRELDDKPTWCSCSCGH
eukprot:gb/GFBE01075341.1/.p1 GENE.gb/GFBE01075341.1/~~gb/GFBE01075341.1/.p1  ORF type:complete len:465 (+),score=101.44 gb/GFBE01075341.1/:1-1395(+)